MTLDQTSQDWHTSAERKLSRVRKERIRNIYEALPKLNCGLCGYENCGQFARAVAEGRASPFGCQQNPWLGHRISQTIGIKVPTYGNKFPLTFISRAGPTPSARALREETQGLSRMADGILARIDKLAER
jgi:hypothetical protein